MHPTGWGWKVNPPLQQDQDPRFLQGSGRGPLTLNLPASHNCTQQPDPLSASGCWVCGFLSHTPADPSPLTCTVVTAHPITCHAWLNLSSTHVEAKPGNASFTRTDLVPNNMQTFPAALTSHLAVAAPLGKTHHCARKGIGSTRAVLLPPTPKHHLWVAPSAVHPDPRAEPSHSGWLLLSALSVLAQACFH